MLHTSDILSISLTDAPSPFRFISVTSEERLPSWPNGTHKPFRMDICLIDAVRHCPQIFVRHNVLRIVPVHIVHIVPACISIDVKGFVATGKSVRKGIHTQDAPYYNGGTSSHLGIVSKHLRVIAEHPSRNTPLLFGPFDRQFLISGFGCFADNFQTAHHVFAKGCEIASDNLPGL